MKKIAAKKSRTIKPGGVDKYIASWPKDIQLKLSDLRKVIRSAVPTAIETMSYFDMPGYSYEGYSYNGMFAWFSFKAPFVRLHVRPQAIIRYKKDLVGFAKTKAIVSFPSENPIPKILIKKLVLASLKDMKEVAE